MSMIEKGTGRAPEFSTLIIIGAGMSGIAAAVHFKKKFGKFGRSLGEDYVIYEKEPELGGTWWANSYPGCAVDIPAMFYSFSFESKYNWSHFYPEQRELLEYAENTAIKWGVKPKIRFSTEVVSAEWIEDTKRWRVHLRKRSLEGESAAPSADEFEGDTWVHECKILMSCVGGLTIPKKCDIPGIENFEGSQFHSAQWDHSVNITGKNIIVIGNGCSAAQIVPKITPISKSTTQFMRSAQWMVPRPVAPLFGSNESFAKNGPTVFKYIPGLYKLTRFLTFLVQESLFVQFKLTNFGTKERERAEAQIMDYMKKMTPERYHDIVLPKYKLGCKRRVLDDGYLTNLSAPNMHLSNERIAYVGTDHVVTESGVKYPADVIVRANGFDVSSSRAPFKIVGRGGETLTDHWKAMGGPAAYNTCVINGFPNFFMTFGPNSVTGHSSVLMASESIVGFALKVSEPVITGRATEVEIKKEAEEEYQNSVQEGLKNMVWSNSFCQSWYIGESGKNHTSYPFSQLHFIWRCMFPTWKDWRIKYTRSAQLWMNIWKYGWPVMLVLYLLTVVSLNASGGPKGTWHSIMSGFSDIKNYISQRMRRNHALR